MANKKRIISFALGLVLVGLANGSDEENVITTDAGPIRGIRSASDDYLQFLGIPYAEVDVTNPFGVSTPYPKFESTFDADDDSKVCPQIDEIDNEVVGSLDCLSLNVYKPDSATSDNLVPVIVWLNGERFLSGSSGKKVYGPEFLIRHDVIVVSINYRVGAYGFMCLDVPEVPGNQGLKDQLLALAWVKNNIEAFGGNPDKITMLGHGAGAKSVDLHLVSDQETLFNQAILQSGVAIAPPSVTDVDNSLPLELASKLGLETDSVSEALSYLASASTNDVVKATSEIRDFVLPCIEKGDSDKFLSTHPANLKSRVNNMAILLGVTSKEQFSEQSPEVYEDFESLIQDELSRSFDLDDATLSRMVDLVRRLYLGDDPVDDSNRYQIDNFDSDFHYVYPNQRRINDFKSNNVGALYNYVFSYEGQRNFGKYKKDIQSTVGAIHGDELGYLFNIPVFEENVSASDELVINRLTALWTNFAKYGNPTPEVSDLLPIKWEPVNPDVLYYLNIDNELTLGQRPFRRRLSFWDIFYKLFENRQRLN